jgi:hypothetical protein
MPASVEDYLPGVESSVAGDLRALSLSTGIRLIETYMAAMMLCIACGLPEVQVFQVTLKLLLLFHGAVVVLAVIKSNCHMMKTLCFWTGVLVWTFGTLVMMKATYGEVALVKFFPVGYVVLALVSVVPSLGGMEVLINELTYMYIFAMMWVTGREIAFLLRISDSVRLSMTFGFAMLLRPKANPKRLIVIAVWSLFQLNSALTVSMIISYLSKAY